MWFPELIFSMVALLLTCIVLHDKIFSLPDECPYLTQVTTHQGSTVTSVGEEKSYNLGSISAWRIFAAICSTWLAHPSRD
jgi:hypothetical protein